MCSTGLRACAWTVADESVTKSAPNPKPYSMHWYASIWVGETCQHMQVRHCWSAKSGNGSYFSCPCVEICDQSDRGIGC
jgi:hypothetical protein